MHTSALKTPAVMWEHYLVAFCPVSGNSEVSKCRNVFCAEEVFPARTWTPFKMLTSLENTYIVHYPVTRPQFYNDCVELTAKETDGTETLEKPPRAGGAHTRCSGDSPYQLHHSPLWTGSVLLVLQFDYIQKPCAHHSIPTAGNLHHLEQSPCLESCHTLLLRPSGLSAFPWQHPPGAENSFSKELSLHHPLVFFVCSEIHLGFLIFIWENDQSDSSWRKCSQTVSNAAWETNSLHDHVRTKRWNKGSQGRLVRPAILSAASKRSCFHSVWQQIQAPLGNHPPTLRARQKSQGLPGTSSVQRSRHIVPQFVHGHPDLSSPSGRMAQSLGETEI